MNEGGGGVGRGQRSCVERVSDTTVHGFEVWL